MPPTTKKRIGILRGGTGENYHQSLRRGGEIISHISENLGDKYETLDILVDKDGVWHAAGRPIQLSDLMHRVDMVWNVAHANFSHSLDSLAIPHVSESPFFSALKGGKELLREHMKAAGVLLPRSILLPIYQEDFDGPRERYAIKKAKEVHEKFGAPWLVKSFSPEMDMGIHLAKTFPELVAAIEDGVRHQASILVEEFISDRTASVHCVPGFRGEDIYAFPFTPEARPMGLQEKEKLFALAKDLHEHLDAHHYLKSDFALNPRGKIYLLSVESVPDLKPDSHFSLVCESAGAKLSEVVEHMLERTIKV